MNALIIYWSATGNTKRVAETIHNALKNGGVNSVLKHVKEAESEELYHYDLLLIGTPCHSWRVPVPFDKYIREKMKYYNERGCIKLCSPKVPGKRGVVFVTYSGPHTGIDEAIPVGKYVGQFMAHLGFELAGEWYVVGEFHNKKDRSTKGRLGDIRGRPNQQDLDKVTSDVNELLKTVSI